MTEADQSSFGRYSRDAMRVLFAARAELARLGGDALRPEHVLLAMLQPGSGSGHAVLAGLGCPLDALRHALEGLVRATDRFADPSDLPLAPGMLAILEKAHSSASAQIASRDLLLAIVEDGASPAARLLREQGVTAEAVRGAAS